MSSVPFFEAASRMLDFVEQLQAVDNGFLENVNHHPTALLQGLAENEWLTDAEMTALFGRLLQMRAEVDEDLTTHFGVSHPNHQDAHQTLMTASHELDTKEPAES
jgi:hypothetical protein